MIKRISLNGLFFLFTLAVSNTQANENFSECIILGDSLADNGNLAIIPDFSFLSSPTLPYNNGFNNGEFAVELLCESLGLAAEPSLYLTGLPVGTNFAVAGARAGGTELIDLTSQLNAFLASRLFMAPPAALYIVWFGGNDVRDARDTDDPEQAKAMLLNAVDNIEAAINQLIGAGARNILVVNSPNIGQVPETVIFGGSELADRAAKLSRFFNKNLKRAVEEIDDNADVNLTYFRLSKVFTSIIDRSENLGFTNDTDGCFSTLTFLAQGLVVFHPDCNDGANFDQFVFFDEFHPTSRVHALISIAMENAVETLAED